MKICITLKIFIFIVNRIYSSQTLKQKTGLEDLVLDKSTDLKEDNHSKSCLEEENNEVHDKIEKNEIIQQHQNLIWMINSCFKKYVYNLCLNFISYFKYNDQSSNNVVIENPPNKDRIKKRKYNAAIDSLYVSQEDYESNAFDFDLYKHLVLDHIDKHRYLPFNKRRPPLEF